MAAQDFTYAEVGATRDAGRPPGYRHMRERVPVGHGAEAFRNASDALMEFWMHRALPARVDASARRAAPGVSVAVRLGAGPLRLVAPCRIVWTREEERYAGWAYGTLPGHPLAGEESFVVHRDEEDDVWLTVTLFSRPATAPARLAGPLVAAFQRGYARRCGAVLRSLAR
ncbi:Uncharacterized protein, UPF0548 family [Actinomadura meyerae]|uniref:Uncharacterized protein, UPF0548 family n=1 Tax=Actinomadura meyerae TaxID=240840 RepID=A0A239BTB3_9ACTN|nr:DUF1990 domain-containing protein [Actinomadura meyerae]SNS10403.1 Uncharacterized protein, UPF0548 family [Actinomadura meyerae]